MKKLFAEFKEFISRGNVMDMAIGVILATAFGKITASLVNDVFMPFLSWIFGARDMTALNVVVRPAEVDAAGEVVKEAITIGFGTFVGAIIDLILVALVVFAVVKALNKMKKKSEEAPAEPEKPDPQIELLTEIRDLLKK
ncbi:MAG: large-conductance mechanosensitive channel protein MscL [Clostridia bacterium]|nr:large-conductance mechanosensitive channel protein MscL [Clostridia bacterium]